MPAAKSHLALPDRYVALRHVANGGMASVWVAEDRALGREVAVKLLATQFLDDPRAVRRFLREARAAAALSSHPHVVTIYDVGEHDGRPYMVMEHLDGGSVADAVRDGRRVPPGRALAWLRDAASALDAAHAQGVVHRDVKPANLLLDRRGRLAVGDFGIARVAFEDTLTATGQVLGTASYIAPEQVRGEPATAASDVYSLGVVAYRLLTGRRPFALDNFVAQARAHVEDDPPRASQLEPSLPTSVDAPLLRALAKDPGARWPSATAFVDALARALAGVESTAATRVHTLAAPTGPRRRWLAWGALGVVALTAALVVLLVGGGTDKRARPTPVRSPAASPPVARPLPRPTTATPTPTPADDPAALNDRGFALVQSGRYAEAIPILGRAVDGACQAGAGLTCAYALYNLGHSLRLAGRPAQAIPILERRLQFDDQRDVVRRELDLARREAGGMAPSREHGKNGKSGKSGKD
jgi:eukaryotic-like serine/threonine-protein kinase